MLKAELEDLKAGAELVKDQVNGPAFKEGAAKLKEKKQPDSRLSYREVFGMPPFSEDEWTAFKDTCEKKKIKFEDKDYGK